MKFVQNNKILEDSNAENVELMPRRRRGGMGWET